MARPPESVRRVMECVHLILSEEPVSLKKPPAWADVLRTCVRLDFLTKVKRYDVVELLEKPALVDHLCRAYFLEHHGMEPLRPARVRHGSHAVVAFFGWTVSVVAGILPAWEVDEVGGEEARRVIEEMEGQRQALARKLLAQKDLEAQRKAEAEAKRRSCEIATQTTPRPTDDARKEEEDEEERRRQAELELREWEMQQEAERLRQEAERLRLQELEDSEKKQKKHEESDGDEESSEDENEGKDHCTWDVSGNPNRRFLEGDGHVVRFLAGATSNFVNVMSQIPFKRGVHYFAFVMHQIGDEQWCGLVTADNSYQAGALVSGRSLNGWSYYCGRRQPKKPQDQASLHVNRQVVQDCAQVSSGDTIGLLVDASKRAAAFLRNGEVQGAFSISASRQALYVFTHLDAPGDCVELQYLPPIEAPQSAVDAILAITGARNLAGMKSSQVVALPAAELQDSPHGAVDPADFDYEDVEF